MLKFNGCMKAHFLVETLSRLPVILIKLEYDPRWPEYRLSELASQHH